MLIETLVALGLPGWNAHRRRPALAALVALAGLGAPLAVVGYVLFSGRRWAALALDGDFLAWLMVAASAAMVARLVAVAEAWHAAGWRPARSWRDRVAIALVAAVTLTAGIAVVQIGRSRAALAPAFVASGDAPLFDATVDEPPEPPLEPVATVAPETTVAAEPDATTPLGSVVVVTAPPATTTTLPPEPPPPPDSGVDPAQLVDVWNVLLIGGDAGPGRSGLRTDTMMLFSLHLPSGRAALVSIPRDLRRIRFPPSSALGQRFAWGFDDIANAVYPYVSSRRELRDAYRVEDVHPGVVATAQAIGFSLDVTIHDYALVDMQGFLELIDAVGGVTVDVRKPIPMPGNVPGAPTQYPDTIGPGVIHMDGSTALGYVRSRKGDSDYQRTARQRQLLAALAQQISLTEVLASFPSVSAAIGGTLRTSMSPDELTNVLLVIGGETAIVESVGLVPPLVSMNRPDFDRMAKVVGEVQLALVGGYRSGY